jgi:broad specificity phosphatase PhoE
MIAPAARFSLYITHPEVVIDPAVPTPRWGLSAMGAARARAFVARGLLPYGWPIFSSTEQKALDLSAIVAAQSGGEVIAEEAFGENDRSSTGYLPAPAFEALADRFFSEPDANPEGWESARDAQRRIVGAVRAALERSGGPAIFCGHGAVGTLLKCHVGQRPISRGEDQRFIGWKGGGNCFAFTLEPPRLAFDWLPMEEFAGVPGVDAGAATR